MAPGRFGLLGGHAGPPAAGDRHVQLRRLGVLGFAARRAPERRRRLSVIEGSYAPYYQFTIDLHQPIAEKFGVGGGADIRQLEDASDEGLYNHSFRNFYLQADASRLWQGSKLSVRGDYWDAVGGDDIHSVGAELEQKVGSFLRLRVGTSFALYRIDLFTGDEKERDRTYYARFRWRLWQGLDLDTDYQYEKDSITEYHTLIVGLRKWF
jgi:hypothetical protein